MKKHWLVGLVFVLVISLSACGSKAPQGSAAEGEEVARPSNPGGPGQAVDLQGDAAKGADTFQAACASCHGNQGTGGVTNIGTKDGTVPELNPIDPTMKSPDAKVFATNIDLFIEHGSTPEAEAAGKTPAFSMPAFGDQKMLQPQDTANLIAYVISLNK